MPSWQSVIVREGRNTERGTALDNVIIIFHITMECDQIIRTSLRVLISFSLLRPNKNLFLPTTCPSLFFYRKLENTTHAVTFYYLLKARMFLSNFSSLLFRICRGRQWQCIVVTELIKSSWWSGKFGTNKGKK